nr:hypothetical protein [Tanacetum cinerariifolium]
MNQTQRANNSINNDILATLFGKCNYKEDLIDQIYESETNTFTIQGSSLKALISNTYFQETYLDVEEDTKSNKEFLADLNQEFNDKALLVNQMIIYKRSRTEPLPPLPKLLRAKPIGTSNDVIPPTGLI